MSLTNKSKELFEKLGPGPHPQQFETELTPDQKKEMEENYKEWCREQGNQNFGIWPAEDYGTLDTEDCS